MSGIFICVEEGVHPFHSLFSLSLRRFILVFVVLILDGEDGGEGRSLGTGMRAVHSGEAGAVYSAAKVRLDGTSHRYRTIRTNSIVRPHFLYTFYPALELFLGHVLRT